MTRPSDWSPVGLDEDPTPGDPDAVRTAAAQWRDASDTIARVRAGITRVGRGMTESIWEGESGHAFRERLRPLPPVLLRWGSHVDDARATASRWADTMQSCQQQADRALTHAAQVQAHLQQAQERLLQARVDAITATTAGLDDAEAAVRGWAGAVQDAQTDLNMATKTVMTAKEAYDEAARTAVRRMRQITDDINVIADTFLPDARLTYGQLEHASTATLFTWLENADPARIKAMLTAHRGLAREFWNHPPDPRVVAAWWAALPAAARTLFTTDAAAIIGNLGGIPYGVRDTANRAQFAADLKNPHLTADQRAALRQLQQTLTYAKKHRIPTQIIDYDMAGDSDAGNPLMAVAYGNMDTAASSTWMAPGMDYNASKSLASWGRAGVDLYQEQGRVDPEQTHAVVAWMGYDAPDMWGEAQSSAARAGAVRFAAELDANGMTRASSGVPVSVDVVAHSYGTTMAADALMKTHSKVASFTMIGSAGLDRERVPLLSQLHVNTVNVPGQSGRTPAVFTTAASNDRLAPFGALTSLRAEPNPVAADPGGWVAFGAESFGSNGDPAAHLIGVNGHNPLGQKGSAAPSGFLNASPSAGHGYFDPNTQSLWNMAATSTGQYQQVDGGLTKTTPQDLFAGAAR